MKPHQKYAFTILFLFSGYLEATDLGTRGIIHIPSARMDIDGSLKVTLSHQAISDIYNISYQATPWLETTFRYSYGDIYQDRSYSVKANILKENRFVPEISIGIQDILGTGIWSSEYLVATKQIKNFDFTLGLGWGRLAGENKIKNPLINFSDSLKVRGGRYSGGNLGGKIRGNSFFRGENVGIFGGIKYQIPSSNLKLLAEYNTDHYQIEKMYGYYSNNSPLRIGIEYQKSDALALNLSTNNENDFILSFSAQLDTKKNVAKKRYNSFYSSLENGVSLKNTTISEIDKNNWYHRLVYDFDKSGLLLRSVKIHENGDVSIEFSNNRFNLIADAINRALNLSRIHISSSAKKIELILNQDGHRVIMVSYKTTDSFGAQYSDIDMKKIVISPPYELQDPLSRTIFSVPYTNFNANVSSQFQLFDPGEPIKYQMFLKINSITNISQRWNLIGSYALDLKNNFDTKNMSSSKLSPVRTEIDKYLVDGSSGIDSFYLEKRSSIENIHYRIYMGVLERMYSGIGLEVLYQPFRSRLAFGSTINLLRKRGYKRNFELLDYETTTSFLSIYYASLFYNYDFSLHLGKYLAKDKGATLEVRRTFDNGFSIGGFFTLTDVSSSDFGEGSFDKGLYFRIPFDSFTKNNTKNSYSTTIRSIQRDGGQRLEEFTGTLWSELRSLRYDSIENNRLRMMPE